MATSALLDIFNFSNDVNASENMDITLLRFTPSCQAVSGGVCVNADINVFSIEDPAVGVPGTSCAGVTFAISPPDLTGTVTLTPNPSAHLGPADNSGLPNNPPHCQIQMNATAVRLPLDSTPPNAPLTTIQITRALIKGQVSGTQGGAGGIATVSVNAEADISITKSDGVSSVTSGAAVTYAMVLTNAGPSPGDGSVLKDPQVGGLLKTSVSCGSETGGAVCPNVADLTIANLEGSGVVIPTLPLGSSMTFTIQATIDAPGGDVTNTVTITPPVGTTNSGDECNSRIFGPGEGGSFDGGTGTCSATDTDTVTPLACFLGDPSTNTAYPYGSGFTNTAFNESTVLKRTEPFVAVAGGTVRLWYSDEHALALGIRQANVDGVITNYNVTTFLPLPAGAPPGTLALSSGVAANFDPVASYVGGDPVTTNLPLNTGVRTCAEGGCDPAGRPIAPALFCTDITFANTNLGDWQLVATDPAHQGGNPPDFVSGTWKSATNKVTSGVPVTSVDADPSANVTKTSVPVTWVAGPDAEAPDPGGYDSLTSLEKYGAEVRWNVDSPTMQCFTPAHGAFPDTWGPMQAGHLYRVQFLIHDGDQNKSGGDSGQACALIAR